MSEKEITKVLSDDLRFQDEVSTILDRLSDGGNVISEEYLEHIHFKLINKWVDEGKLSKSLAYFLRLFFQEITTQSRVIKWSAERLKSGEWKTYNKYEGL